MTAERPHSTAPAGEESDLSIDTDVAAADAEAAAAEAEALAAEAQARAAAARARAIRSRLRTTLPDNGSPAIELPETDDATAEIVEVDTVPATDAPPRRSRTRLVGWLAAAVAVVLIIACGAASLYLVRQHRALAQTRTLTAEFNAAARQGVINLMSVDFNDVDANVKRLLDSSTGKFRSDLQDALDPLTKSLKEAKVVTTVSVDSTAVESVSADNGVVLVAASTEAQDPSSKDPRPAKWRISVTLTRDGGQLKMSQVDFVAQ